VLPRFCHDRWYRSLGDDVETRKAAEQFTHATTRTSTFRCTPPGYRTVFRTYFRASSAPVFSVLFLLIVLSPAEVAPSIHSSCLTVRTCRGGQLFAMPHTQALALQRQGRRHAFCLRNVLPLLYLDILFDAHHRPPRYSPTAPSPRP
jgi:hypothetical protein